MVTYLWPTLFVKVKRCKSWNKEKVLPKLLSKALTGLLTTDWAKTNQMTIPFVILPWIKCIFFAKIWSTKYLQAYLIGFMIQQTELICTTFQNCKNSWIEKWRRVNLNLIFTAYVAWKNSVRNSRQKIQFVKLDFSN